MTGLYLDFNPLTAFQYEPYLVTLKVFGTAAAFIPYLRRELFFSLRFKPKLLEKLYCWYVMVYPGGTPALVTPIKEGPILVLGWHDVAP